MKFIDFVQWYLSDRFVIWRICRRDLICRTDFVICRTDFENLSDRFVGQKTNFVGHIKFVGQMDFRIFRFLHLSDRFVGQITNSSEQNIFCRTDLICTNIVSEFCRTDLLFVGQKTKFVICRTNFVRLFVFVGQNLSDRFFENLSDKITNNKSKSVGHMFLRICRTE